MATVTYNTKRYQWFTLFAASGCILSNQPVDTQSENDMQMVSEAPTAPLPVPQALRRLQASAWCTLIGAMR